jgi:hypothetical protein
MDTEGSNFSEKIKNISTSIHIQFNVLLKYYKTYKKIRKTDLSKMFLLKCRKFGFIPNFIAHSTNKTKKSFNKSFKELPCVKAKVNSIISNLHIKLLNVYIDGTVRKLEKLKKYSKEMEFKIKEKVPNGIFKKLLIIFDNNIEEMCSKTSERHTKKFDKLREEFLTENNININEKWFINLTDLIVPLEVKWLLSLGKNFAVPTKIKKIELFHIIADTESILENVEDLRDRDVLRAKVCNILHNNINKKNIFTPLDRFLVETKKITDEFLKTHIDIIVVQADKGKATVLMSNKMYEDKMYNLLNDGNYFIAPNCNLTKLQNRSNNLFEKLQNEGVIDEVFKKKMTSKNTNLPRIYALPKVHKKDVPLRPIVDYTNTPASNLAIFLKNILNQLDNNRYDIKNSFSLIEKIENIKLSRSERLISFDVISLFPSIPILLVKSILEEKWEIIKNYTNISKTLFFEILDFTIDDSTYFVFNNTVFKQIDGSAMGSNLSPILANIIMNELLDWTFNELQIKPKLIVKYVDDLLMILPSRKIKLVLDKLNSFHQNLKFTFEEENNNQLPYLDLLLLKDNDGYIKYKWYQKEISSNKLLNFLSSHPYQHKRNTAFNLLNRAFKLTSPEFRNQSLEIAKKYLLENSYPLKLIKKIIHQILTNSQNSANVNQQIPANSTTRYRSLKYIKNCSDQICKIIKPKLNNIKVAYQPVNTLGTSTMKNLKQKINIVDRSNVIYTFPCSGNNNQNCNLSYVGQTKNKLSKRIKEHIYDLKSKVGIDNTTSVVKHLETKGHFPDFSKIKILDYEKNLSKRLTIESLHILSNNTYNQRRETERVSNTYCALFEQKNSSL